ncbi:flagellar motor switch protein FliG [bacterium]|jgi:flagellar motor switch protein FliG|nr:flagellar motor switch protein FliG [bacterium]MDB2396579.1 flagellar motor switch protein FliG [Planktomarina temperata]HAW18802.1 flagellar motor switch protein FliG [Flavobacteriales bacterium]MDB2690592.1 flagellar motor switch protein FliG [Planktomarina temperata]MDB9855912.1 flagellar motor switch protein FliG [Planktomarina temperata]
MEQKKPPHLLLTGTQKSAILMMLLGEDGAAEILRNLSPKEAQSLGSAMYSVKDIDQETVNHVLNEFLSIVRQQTGLGFGSGNYIKNVFTKALGDDKAESILTRITPSSSEKPIELLEWMDARSIAELISAEHSQIISLVLSYLEYDLAAEVLSLLPVELQPEIITRIATLETVQPDALRNLQEVLQKKFKENSSVKATKIGGVEAAAKIMNFSDTAIEKKILETIKENDGDLLLAIQDRMFIFDNLILSDERALQTLLREIEEEVLALALKGSDEVLRDKLLSCMSKRAASNIKDEIEVMGPVRLSEVQEAQKTIVSVARKLSDEGKIVLAGSGGEEMV